MVNKHFTYNLTLYPLVFCLGSRARKSGFIDIFSQVGDFHKSMASMGIECTVT